MFKTAQACVEWVMQRQKKNHQAASLEQVMRELGNPQDKFRSIHIAGTNGKGSTGAYLRSLFLQEGYRVGSFHSPHYITHYDRIRFGENPISENDFWRLCEAKMPFILKYDLGMFDIDFLVMCAYFIECQVDIAIIEAGIGGRHDASNVLHHPELAIITGVGYDHMELLGNTLEEITADKAGIAKKNSLLLVGNLPATCQEVAKRCATEVACKFRKMAPLKKTREGFFRYRGKEYQVASLADYQLENACLALEAKHLIYQKWQKEDCPERDQKALLAMRWPGRFEIVHQKPLVILDGAHNPQAITALMESVRKLPGRKAALFAALRRKQVAAMYALLCAECEEVLMTSFAHPQALRYEEIQMNPKVADWRRGLQDLMKQYDVVIICGSLYFLSEVAAQQQELFLGK